LEPSRGPSGVNKKVPTWFEVSKDYVNQHHPQVTELKNKGPPTNGKKGTKPQELQKKVSGRGKGKFQQGENQKGGKFTRPDPLRKGYSTERKGRKTYN